MSIRRWTFTDTVTGDSVVLPVNPNKMDSPTFARDITWAWNTSHGMAGVQSSPTSTQWSFGGVILTQEQYSLLLNWANRLSILQITDHLNRTMQVIITHFDPVERQTSATRPWLADYTMTCLLIPGTTVAPPTPISTRPITFDDQSLPDDWIVAGGDGNPVYVNLPDAGVGTTYALAFPDINDGETTTYSFSMTSDGTTAFTVRYNVSSENGYDYFSILVDGTQKVHESGPIETWEQYAEVLSAGSHDVVLQYAKDVSVSVGSDTTRISYVTW